MIFYLSTMLLLFILLIVFLSAMLLLFTLTKKKGSLCENLVEDNSMQKSEFEPLLGDVAQIEAIQESETSHNQGEVESYPSFPLDGESNNIIDKKFELNAQKHEQQDDPYSDSSFPSDSESSTGSIIDESFEIDLRINQDMSLSDNFASDNEEEDDDEDEEEDGLIEIKLPSSNFSSLNEDIEEYSKQNLDFIFKEQGLMDLLAEINEDENLIEIDIFNGSTKYQDFRFKELACLGDQCVLSD
ncbi:unnamed protein product [Trifolium pratense]|uniref:Uncharacterized protein n=1 Tax=Trifolium pratense TaxID=57577 RepID=A0ACB0IP71_TRIPR|nr:unnamed protein product [Trifolium pratense]